MQHYEYVLFFLASRENMGFPVVECDREGKIVVSKPENTGGLVSWGTVAEQVQYSPLLFLSSSLPLSLSKRGEERGEILRHRMFHLLLYM